MEEVISLNMVDSTDLRRFDEVYAVQAGDHSNYQQLLEDKRLAQLYDRLAPAQLTVVDRLLIEVESLDDHELLEQLRAKCNAAKQAV